MPLYNASSRARNVGSLVVRNQGGGPIKPGFPYEIGRGQWSSIFIDRQPMKYYQMQRVPWKVRGTRPMGFSVNVRKWGP